VADRILARPAITRERLADYRRVRRIRAVAIVEDASAKQGNSENGKYPGVAAQNRLLVVLLISKQGIEQATHGVQAAGSFGGFIRPH